MWYILLAIIILFIIIFVSAFALIIAAIEHKNRKEMVGEIRKRDKNGIQKN